MTHIYEQLLRKINKQLLVKMRTTIKTERKQTFEIDDYQFYPIKTIDVEFANEKAAINFIPPPWFGNEVSN